jgi:ABC-type taurine transport system ATPase subunit
MYRPLRGKPVLALEDVSLEVDTRGFITLPARPAAVKSTLLYLLGGFLPRLPRPASSSTERQDYAHQVAE